jgi:hypothetical protein
MRMPGIRKGLVVLAVTLLATLSAGDVVLGGGHGMSATDNTSAAELRLLPAVAGGPRGVGLFRQDGTRLRGWVVVWGLRPGSRHAVHCHGPSSRCGRKADPIAVHQDLRADAQGIAYATVDVRSPSQVLRTGVYYNVHRGPAIVSENPEIACANVRPIP